MTNQEIRFWYHHQLKQIAQADAVQERDGISLELRARHAHTARHQARLEARRLMTNPAEVQLLEDRDRAKYGHPDGPTFAQLLAAGTAAGLSNDEAHLQILESATRTDAATDRRLGTSS